MRGILVIHLPATDDPGRDARRQARVKALCGHYPGESLLVLITGEALAERQPADKVDYTPELALTLAEFLGSDRFAFLP